MQSVPEAEGARTLDQLVLALESDQSFPLAKLYVFDYKELELALSILRE